MKIAALISGGVDSSVMVHLLVEQGFKPDLYYIAIGPDKEFLGYDCKMEEDIDLSRTIAKRHGLKFEVIPLHQEYWQMVVQYHVQALRRGETPNPDMLCNQLIKFGAFENQVGKNYDYTATGHYATIIEKDGERLLGTAKDVVKDQTYFLAQISILQLSKLMFPIGHLIKSEVREIARKNGIPTAERKDSQGICFIGRNHYTDFVFELLGENIGSLIEKETGKSLGTHKGHWFHTIGQRKGLGLSGGPWFVVDKDIEKNIVFVDRGYEPASVYGTEVVISDFSWLYDNSKGFEQNRHSVCFKIRHTPTFTKGVLQQTENGIFIQSEEKLHGIAPGQYAVVYDRDKQYVIGSGVIKR